jgi:hypothetical protein
MFCFAVESLGNLLSGGKLSFKVCEDRVELLRRSAPPLSWKSLLRLTLLVNVSIPNIALCMFYEVNRQYLLSVFEAVEVRLCLGYFVVNSLTDLLPSER